MLSIQEVGKQVLTGNPNSFYIFVGTEYGLKEKYLDNIKCHYGDVTEVGRVSEFFEVMKKKRIIPLQPKLYIVRYDEEFVQSLNKNSVDDIHKLESKIIGTLVCLYESNKHTDKCIKYLGDYTVSFDWVNQTFVKKYLTSDFPNLDGSLVDFSVSLHSDYKGAYNTCISLSNADVDVISEYSGTEISKALGTNFSASNNQFRQGFASRNMGYCLSVIDNYDGQLDMLLYTALAVLIDLEKLISSPKQKSDLSKYIKCWNTKDIYNMFMHIYIELEKSRTISTYDIYLRMVYLLGLMQFSPVPEVSIA